MTPDRPKLTYQMCLLLLLLAVAQNLSLARDVNFDDIFVDAEDMEDYIPKVSHFVFSKLKDPSWLEFAAIKSSVVNLGVEKINLWMPSGSVPKGEVWQAVLSLPEATIREVEMPTTIYGNPVAVLAHVSDLIRLEALYLEGGIYMDYNVIALRSSDAVIYNASTNSTVMGRELVGLCNAMIMSKRHAPFMRTWMSAYVDFKDEDWMSLSVGKPWELAQQGIHDITVLDISTWFFPTYLDADNVWLGQSYVEIDNNYGVHMWGSFRVFYPLMTPESVREIDTPLFCRVRHLFDDVRGPYIAADWHSNPNCSFTTMDKLQDQNQKLMGSYTFDTDSAIKIVDSSGNNLHGWAPFGTAQPLENGLPIRAFGKGENAWIPVPVDYDGRVGTIAIEMLLQVDTHQDSNVTIAMLRLDNREIHIYWRLLYDSATTKSSMEIEWCHQNVESSSFIQYIDIRRSIHDDRYHTFNLSWDRNSLGFVRLAIDDIELLRESVTKYERSLRGYELWLNSVSDSELDMGLRARLRSLQTYGEARSDSYALQRISGSSRGRVSPENSRYQERPRLDALGGLALGVLTTILGFMLWLRKTQLRQKWDEWRGCRSGMNAGVEYELLTDEHATDDAVEDNEVYSR